MSEPDDTVAMVLADASGQIRHWSPGAEKLFGHRAADAIGRRLDLIVPSEYRDRHWAAFDAVVDTGQWHLDGSTVNLPVRCADEQVRSFPARFVAVRDPYGATIGAMAVFAPRTGDEQPWQPVPARAG